MSWSIWVKSGIIHPCVILFCICKFCENWCSESHILLKGNEILSMCSFLLFNMKQFFTGDVDRNFEWLWLFMKMSIVRAVLYLGEEINFCLSFPHLLSNFHEIWYKRCACRAVEYFREFCENWHGKSAFHMGVNEIIFICVPWNCVTFLMCLVQSVYCITEYTFCNIVVSSASIQPLVLQSCVSLNRTKSNLWIHSRDSSSVAIAVTELWHSILLYLLNRAEIVVCHGGKELQCWR